MPSSWTETSFDGFGRLCRRNRDCERGERGERKPEDARSTARVRDLHSVFPLVVRDRTLPGARLSTAPSRQTPRLMLRAA